MEYIKFNIKIEYDRSDPHFFAVQGILKLLIPISKLK